MYGIEKILQRIADETTASENDGVVDTHTSPYQLIVQGVVLPLITSALARQEATDARTEHITLLGSIVRLFPGQEE